MWDGGVGGGGGRVVKSRRGRTPGNGLLVKATDIWWNWLFTVFTERIPDRCKESLND